MTLVERRAFLAGLAATGALAASGCSSGDGGAGGDGSGDVSGDGALLGGGATTTGATAPVLGPGGVPTAETMLGWIEEVVAQGVRRPGYDAADWTEQHVASILRAVGLDDVRLEPVAVTRWEPTSWRCEVTPAGGESVALECFPLPYSAPVDDLVVELAPFRSEAAGEVAGRAALVEARVVRVAPTSPVTAGSAPDDLRGRVYDPDGSFDAEGEEHVLPHTVLRNRIVEPVVEAGAAAFVGALVGYPGDGCRYFVPYHGEPLPIPGVWLRGSDGAWLRDQLARGPVQLRLQVASSAVEHESHNVVGELPGADDELVIVGSHHDGPWASAVEDGTGIALVLAQAAHWAARPVGERPHRLRFVLHAGHMCGGAGLHAYLEAHEDELERVVLEVHLEHAAAEWVERADGRLEPTGRCVPRWFFTSRIPVLEEAVTGAIEAADLRRSMILAPDALGQNPPTDGGRYHRHGVPIVQFLAAPWYLFDERDTLDKVDVDGLVPLTRATIEIIESTAGTTAAALRAAVVR